MRLHPSVLVVLLAASMGFIFAAVSTYDSAAHLDRQVHGIHCSYFLGMGATDASGTTGCYATLMSAYSSVFRKSVWGGVPVALPGMAVFGFIGFAVLWIAAKRRFFDVRSAGFLTAACLVPLLTTFFMAYVSIKELDTVCKVCMGIYIASAAVFLGALWMLIFAVRHGNEVDGDSPPVTPSFMGAAFLIGVLFVAVPVAAYGVMAPDFSKYVGNCGKLASPEDPGRILIPMGAQNRPTEMIEVIDPLCVACGVFEKRFSAMPEKDLVRRKVMLFPLDKQCNWMIDESIHPGACAVSEAMLCAEERAEEVLNFAVATQDRIIEEAKKDPTAAARIMKAKFPEFAQCIGSASARAKLNLSLRWAVKNQLHILTPQVYIDGYRLCDEDTDLGLEYALSRLITKDFIPGAEPEMPAAAPIAAEPVPPKKAPARKAVPSPAAAPAAPAALNDGTGAPRPGTDDLDAKLKQVTDRIDAMNGNRPDTGAPTNAPPPPASGAAAEGVPQ